MELIKNICVGFELDSKFQTTDWTMFKQANDTYSIFFQFEDMEEPQEHGNYETEQQAINAFFKAL